MTEKQWHTGLFDLKEGKWQCVVACCFGCLGACLVQACNAKQLNGKVLKPLCCAGCLLCFGMAVNRKAIRKEYQIQGNCLLDSLLFIFGCCFLVAQEYREIDYQKSKRVTTVKPPPPPIQDPTESVKKEDDTKPPSPVAGPDGPLEVRPKAEQEEGRPAGTDNTSVAEGSESDHPLIASKGVGRNRLANPPPAGTQGDQFAPETESERSMDASPSPAFVEIPVTEIAIIPLDGNDPRIYSVVKATPPLSFLLGIEPAENLPPPTYLPLSVLKQPKPHLSRDIWVGLEKDEEGGLVCVDQEALRRQEGVATHVIKQLGWAIIKGLGAVSISLPIRIFEPRSTCERLIDRFSFAPVFLSRAAASPDKWERFKLVLAFAVSSMYMGVKQEKPFNPLLGETMQGSFPDGGKIYCEHTMHNPPTDHFYIVAGGYSVYGYYQLDGSFTGNSLVGSFRGPTTVYFRDGQMITYQQPKFRLGGVLAGKRTLNWEGDLTFEDPTNNWVAVIKIQTSEKAFNPRKLKLKRDQFLGKIYTPLGDRRDKIGEVLAELSGSWMESLKIETPSGTSEVIWTIDDHKPLRHTIEDCPLPSDWRYREDLIWLFRGDQDTAQAWKSKLEQRQREDREKRAEGAKRHRR